jgi:hypothetical protein
VQYAEGGLFLIEIRRQRLQEKRFLRKGKDRNLVSLIQTLEELIERGTHPRQFRGHAARRINQNRQGYRRVWDAVEEYYGDSFSRRCSNKIRLLEIFDRGARRVFHCDLVLRMSRLRGDIFRRRRGRLATLRKRIE